MKLKLVHDGHEIEATAEMIAGVLWVHNGQRTFAVDVAKKKSRSRARAGSSGGNEIEAPMPGKITKIIRSEGESVAKGDSVIVMEAMKMEYTLKAEIPGKIGKITCKVGDQVSPGQCLVEISGESK